MNTDKEMKDYLMSEAAKYNEVDHQPNSDKQNMIDAAIACGFRQSDLDGINFLICTPDQLVQYSAEIAKAVIEQLNSEGKKEPNKII